MNVHNKRGSDKILNLEDMTEEAMDFYGLSDEKKFVVDESELLDPKLIRKEAEDKRRKSESLIEDPESFLDEL